MFSPQIVESEEFLTMPTSSQALYFHLGMSADDDGFIQPKVIMRQIGSADDDLKVLLAKRFLLPFESGVVVIKHWLIHNLIQKDRYHPTRFQEEKKLIILKENKAYTDDLGSVNKMLPEVRLGKVNKYTELPKTGDSDTTLKKPEPRPKSRFGVYSEEESYEEPAVDLDSGEVIAPEPPKRLKEARSAIQEYNELIRWGDELRGFPTLKQSYLKQYAALKVAKTNGITRNMLYERFREYHEGKFSAPNGFDWTTVVYSFNRKR